MSRPKGSPEWHGKENVFEVGNEMVRFRATDFGNLGIKVDFESNEGNVATVIPPDKAEQFSAWMNLLCVNEVMCLPAHIENVFKALLEKNKSAKFMSRKERAALTECIHNLEQLEVLRTGGTELIARALNRNHVGINSRTGEVE
jgi:hypothetical protein